MEIYPPQAQRSILARIFLSSEESRLRAGWRLLLHTLMTVGLIGILGLVVGTAAFVLAGPDPEAGRLEALLFSPAFNGLLSIAAFTLSTWVARRFLDRRSFASLGLRFDGRTVSDLAFGFALPGLLMGLIYIVEVSLGWISFEGWAWETAGPFEAAVGILGGLGLYIMVGYYEELMSRGYHLQNLLDGLNLPWAIFLSSSLFAVLHLGNPNASITSTVGILAAGYFLAYAWVRTRQLWLPIGLHIGWNFFQGTIFGFPVSGTTGFHLVRQSVSGPDLITGGLFGPEAGLIVLPALGLGAILISAYTRQRRPEAPPG
jgi:uncharacterized protein